MEKYIFILGRDPELSKEELFTYLTARNITYSILDQSDIAVILTLDSINAPSMIKDLGGIQKIALIIESFDRLYQGNKNKVRYAISKYSEEEEDLKDELKAYFKAEGIKATIKKSHHQEQEYLTPSEAKNVVEIMQYKRNVAKVLAVFNPNEYKLRDTKRPVQRPLHTISIRLAKIMINLSGIKPKETLLDPFCGIGTIMQEAMLMGIPAIGIDKDKSCIEASQKNLQWIQKHYNLTLSFRLIHGDARKVSILVPRVDSVATEPYMGPFIKGYPTLQEAKKIMKELIPLYTELIGGLLKVTRNKIVIITPRFRTRAKIEVPLDLAPILEKKEIKWKGPLLYSSPTSKMLREIWIIEK